MASEHEDTIPARPGRQPEVVIPTGYDEQDLIAQRPAQQVTVNRFAAEKQAGPRPVKRLPPGQASMQHEEETVGSVPPAVVDDEQDTRAYDKQAERPQQAEFTPEQIAQVASMLNRGVIPVGPMSLNPPDDAPPRRVPAAPAKPPKVKVIYALAQHSITAKVRTVLVEPRALVVVSDLDDDSMEFTPALGGLTIIHEGVEYSVLYAGVQFEYTGQQFQVFQRR